MCLIFNHLHLKLMKAGKILSPITKSHNKIYPKAKLYLRDDSLVGKRYGLYGLGDAAIEETSETVKVRE